MYGLIKICAVAALSFALAVLPAGAAAIKLGRGINLDIWDSWPAEARWGERAALLPYPQWQARLGPDAFVDLKRAGFDFVRIPVDPAPFLSPKTQAFRDALFQSVLQAVRTVNEAGMKAVVDLHAIPSGDRSFSTEMLNDDAALFDRYIALVGRMARTLAEEDAAGVALELMNEPQAGCDGRAERWAAMLAKLHAAARMAAQRLTLVLPGGCWSGAESLAALDPAAIGDDNVMWTFHSYAPFLLTHQGAGWAGDFIRYVAGIPYPPNGDNAEKRDAALDAIRARIAAEAPLTRRAGMLAYLDELVAEIDTPAELQTIMAAPFAAAAAWADGHKIARGDILLGEFGMIRQEYGTSHVMPPKWRAAYVGDMIALAEQHDFSWAVWGYGGAFGVVEAFDGRPAEPAVLDIVRALP
ncbi:MAG: cellulase family glycosylhydrolase [Rhizobiaceae bacterium]